MIDRSVVISKQLFEGPPRATAWRAWLTAMLTAAAKAAAVLAAAAVLIGFSSAPGLCKVVCKPVITVQAAGYRAAAPGDRVFCPAAARGHGRSGGGSSAA